MVSQLDGLEALLQCARTYIIIVVLKPLLYEKSFLFPHEYMYGSYSMNGSNLLKSELKIIKIMLYVQEDVLDQLQQYHRCLEDLI